MTEREEEQRRARELRESNARRQAQWAARALVRGPTVIVGTKRASSQRRR